MEPWGYSTHIDLYDCSPNEIRDPLLIVKYVHDLIDLIEMKRWEGCVIEHFGEDEKVKGYTFMQLIETSLISGHLVELTNDAHIDIFSCKKYDANLAHEFTVNYFKAKKSKFIILER